MIETRIAPAHRYRRSIGRIFALPAAIGAASALGLVLGLVGEGWWDVAACLLLGIAAVAGLLACRRS